MERFIKAQENVYKNVIEELRNEKKRTHWMWYIFPQLRFLGKSDRAVFYGIADVEEAKTFCSNKLLHNRYLECCNILLQTKENSPTIIMGEIDAIKLQSSLTLFYLIDETNSSLYRKLIDKFYNGEIDVSTYNYIKEDL